MSVRDYQVISGRGPTVDVFDRRALALKRHPKAERAPRALADIEGNVIHQTGVEFSPGLWKQHLYDRGIRGSELEIESLILRLRLGPFRHQPWNGNRPGKRYGGVAAHIIVGPGFVLLANPFDRVMWGSNGSNEEAVQTEVIGRFPGREKDRHSRWAKVQRIRYSEMSEDLAAAIEVSLDITNDELPHARFLWAHRQSSATRRADPGEAIWNVAAKHGRHELGLQLQPERTWWRPKGRSGRPLPREWYGGEARY